MPSIQRSIPSPVNRCHASHLPTARRATLRDLYTFGLVSVFRRHSLLRIWEPQRETPSLIPREQSAD